MRSFGDRSPTGLLCYKGLIIDMLSPRRIPLCRAVVSALMTAVLLAACGGAPQRSLYYVWGRNCPPPTALNPDRPAGFTSRSAARLAARVETRGPAIYWHIRIRKFNAQLGQALADRSLKGPARTDLLDKLHEALSVAYTGLRSYAHCTRYVVKGKPNP